MINNFSELEFFKVHEGLIYHPTCFRFGDEKYSPDFYDPETNIYYEIIGSRQRLSQINKEGKIERFKKAYPKINLVFYRNNDAKLPKNSNKGIYKHLALKTGTCYATIHHILSRLRRPSPALAEKLQEATGIKKEAWLFPDEYDNPLIGKANK